MTSRDYCSVCTIAARDYEPMYTYKCDEYEHCLHLCQQIEQNVNSLLNVTLVTCSFSLPSSVLLLLMEDDCLSLIGLCSLAAGVYDDKYNNERVYQLSLSSLYLVV